MESIYEVHGPLTIAFLILLALAAIMLVAYILRKLNAELETEEEAHESGYVNEETKDV